MWPIIDNRATTSYVYLYSADFLQEANPMYKPVFKQMSATRAKIVDGFKVGKGKPVNLGGYYLFCYKKHV